MKNLYLVKENGKCFHAGILAEAILRRYPNIREMAEYSALEDRFFDYTQACDVEEQRGWMGHYMEQAIKMDRQACELRTRGKEFWNTAEGQRFDAAIQFIVAYDMIA